MMFNHEGRDLEHQVQRSVRSFGSLVLDVEAHDAESGLSVIRLPPKQGTTHEGTRVPSLRTTCPEPRSSCTSRRPLENFSPQDCTMLELGDVELFSQENGGHVRVRSLQRNHVPWYSNERLDVVGSVATQVGDELAFCHLATVRQNTLHMESVPVEGTTDRSLLHCTRQVCFYRHRATHLRCHKDRQHGLVASFTPSREDRWRVQVVVRGVRGGPSG